jgi:hypothetical protein
MVSLDVGLITFDSFLGLISSFVQGRTILDLLVISLFCAGASFG